MVHNLKIWTKGFKYLKDFFNNSRILKIQF